MTTDGKVTIVNNALCNINRCKMKTLLRKYLLLDLVLMEMFQILFSLLYSLQTISHPPENIIQMQGILLFAALTASPKPYLELLLFGLSWDPDFRSPDFKTKQNKIFNFGEAIYMTSDFASFKFECIYKPTFHLRFIM